MTTSPLLDRIADSRVATRLVPLYQRLGGMLLDTGLVPALRGEGLGHALHPILTDLPLGFWTSTSALDLMGGRSSRRAAGTLCALGVVSAAPTAAAGLADWTSLTGTDRRLGAVHAAGNSLAVLLYTRSTWLRLRGHHLRATGDALAGAVCLAGAGYLGGHLALNRGTGSRLPQAEAGTHQAPEADLTDEDLLGTPLTDEAPYGAMR